MSTDELAAWAASVGQFDHLVWVGREVSLADAKRAVAAAVRAERERVARRCEQIVADAIRHVDEQFGGSNYDAALYLGYAGDAILREFGLTTEEP